MNPEFSRRARQRQALLLDTSQWNMNVRNKSYETPALLEPEQVDLVARRSISDSVLSRGRSSAWGKANTVSALVNRSGASTVKAMIETINARCLEKEMCPEAGVLAPDEECCVLAQWAVDPYYKIVIAGRQGIPALVKAMQCFPLHQGLQECCCLALGNLCSNGESNLLAVESAGGIHQIVLAMKNHPNSVAVQSAACDALRNTSNLFLSNAHAQQSYSHLRPQLIEVLSHAKDMYLHPAHTHIAESLLRSLVC